jgi:hypothetical protein
MIFSNKFFLILLFGFLTASLNIVAMNDPQGKDERSEEFQKLMQGKDEQTQEVEQEFLDGDFRKREFMRNFGNPCACAVAVGLLGVAVVAFGPQIWDFLTF